MRRIVRWLVPAAVTATVLGGAAVTSAAAGRAPQVPDADVADVLAAVAGSHVTAYSGTVRSRSDLGLPAIPGTSSSSSDRQGLALRLLSGDSTVRIWVDGPRRQRAQLLDELAQADVVHSGRDVWTYSSSDDTATHAVLPADAAAAPTPPATADVPTPQALADQLLLVANPTTEVALGTPQTVAGRPTWTLLVTPRTQETLVAQAQVSVDTATGMPLRVQVVARGQADPAVDVGFTDLDLSTPPAARFAFTPPSTATVTTKEITGTDHASGPAAPTTGARPTVLGQGWTTVVSVPSVGLDAATPAPAEGTAMLDAVTTRVDGGRAVRTALVTALFTDDGRVLVGAVPLATLQALAK